MDLKPLVLSHTFWPPAAAAESGVPEGGYTLPASMAAAQEQFGEQYAVLKQPRRLKWSNTVGLVDLKLRCALLLMLLLLLLLPCGCSCRWLLRLTVSPPPCSALRTRTGALLA